MKTMMMMTMMMKNINKIFGAIIFCALLTLSSRSEGMTLTEKQASFAGHKPTSEEDNIKSAFRGMNQELTGKKADLVNLYVETEKAYQTLLRDKKSESEIAQFFETQRTQIENLRAEISRLEEEWRTFSKNISDKEEEGIWNQPDTTIGGLVMDYGSVDYIYIMPPEIASLKIHVSSALSVPRASWSEILELVVASYGIGIRQLNPFTRQLFFMRLNQAGVDGISASFDELKTLPLTSRICFVISPPPADLRRIFSFLEKFVPQEQMTIQVLSNNIVLVGYVKELLELSKIYAFLVSPKQIGEYRLIALQKAKAEEVAKILLAIFEGDAGHLGDAGSDKHMPFFTQETSSGFRVIALKHPAESLFLLGKPDQIEKACEIITDIESKIGQVQEKTVYLYACRHSEAAELAKVLSQVYMKMIASPSTFEGVKLEARQEQKPQTPEQKAPPNPNPDSVITQDSFLMPPVVNPQWVGAKDGPKKQEGQIHENFIVDLKTNSIVMVVEAYVLPRLKELLKTLDVPKKMVQIEVLLFEKKITDTDNFGMNLLKLGDAASHKNRSRLTWNETAREHRERQKEHRRDYHNNNNTNADTKTNTTDKTENTDKRDHHYTRDRGDRGNRDFFDGAGDLLQNGLATAAKGILSFSISRNDHGFFPAYDVVFNFLLAQEDIQINANPSVVTVNQTPAKIAIVDEISINTGVYDVNATNETRFKNSFARAQYGTTINITPTIHSQIENIDDTEEQKFITVATEVNFDTTNPSANDRPDVTKRNIKNEVRVADGETIILGGLRRKSSESQQDSVPFLGELPWIGKFFSTTELRDSSTEMFIFITPKIIPDPADKMHEMRQKELARRPGDLPEFVATIENVKIKEREKLFGRTLKALFGKPEVYERSVPSP
jgi:general secretion pathway protein D